MIATSTAMLANGLINTLLLAGVLFCLPSVGSSEKSTTCDGGSNVHRLTCDMGVISVQTALYGRADRTTCSEGMPRRWLTNTRCSLRGTTDLVRKRCNSKKVCEINMKEVRTSNPCRRTYKYLETVYTCLPALSVIACENSVAHLYCDVGQVIFVYGARYGRGDSKICGYKRRRSQVRNKNCSEPTNKVAQRCNGKNSCSIRVANSVFGDPCAGTYKYLEVAYICEYPVH